MSLTFLAEIYYIFDILEKEVGGIKAQQHRGRKFEVRLSKQQAIEYQSIVAKYNDYYYISTIIEFVVGNSSEYPEMFKYLYGGKDSFQNQAYFAMLLANIAKVKEM